MVLHMYATNGKVCRKYAHNVYNVKAVSIVVDATLSHIDDGAKLFDNFKPQNQRNEKVSGYQVLTKICRFESHETISCM